MVVSKCDCCGAVFDGLTTNDMKAQVAIMPVPMIAPTKTGKSYDEGRGCMLIRDLCPDCLDMLFTLLSIDPKRTVAKHGEFGYRLYSIWQRRNKDD